MRRWQNSWVVSYPSPGVVVVTPLCMLPPDLSIDAVSIDVGGNADAGWFVGASVADGFAYTQAEFGSGRSIISSFVTTGSPAFPAVIVRSLNGTQVEMLLWEDVVIGPGARCLSLRLFAAGVVGSVVFGVSGVLLDSVGATSFSGPVPSTALQSLAIAARSSGGTFGGGGDTVVVPPPPPPPE